MLGTEKILYFDPGGGHSSVCTQRLHCLPVIPHPKKTSGEKKNWVWGRAVPLLPLALSKCCLNVWMSGMSGPTLGSILFFPQVSPTLAWQCQFHRPEAWEGPAFLSSSSPPPSVCCSPVPLGGEYSPSPPPLPPQDSPIWSLPLQEAKCRAVRPLSSAAQGSAPSSRSCCTGTAKAEGASRESGGLAKLQPGGGQGCLGPLPARHP